MKSLTNMIAVLWSESMAESQVLSDGTGQLVPGTRARQLGMSSALFSLVSISGNRMW